MRGILSTLCGVCSSARLKGQHEHDAPFWNLIVAVNSPRPLMLSRTIHRMRFFRNTWGADNDEVTFDDLQKGI